MSDAAAATAETSQARSAVTWRENLRLAWRLAATIVVTLVLWAGLNLDAIWARRRAPFAIVNAWVARWARAFLWIFNIRLDAQGPFIGDGRLYPGRGANGVGRVFVLNHRSSVDVVINCRLLAAHAISRHDVAGWPLLGRVSRRLGTLFVDRQSRRSGADVLRQVDATLHRGEGVVMFPEGTSYLGDEVRPFKPGAFKAAERARAEMVPLGVAYEDDGACYYHELFTTHLKRIARRLRLRVAVVAGEPVAFDGRTAVEMKDLLHAEVQRLTLAARERLDAAK